MDPAGGSRQEGNRRTPEQGPCRRWRPALFVDMFITI